MEKELFEFEGKSYKDYVKIDEGNYLLKEYNENKELIVTHVKKYEDKYLKINTFNTGIEYPQKLYINYRIRDNFIIFTSENGKYMLLYDYIKCQILTDVNLWNRIDFESYEDNLKLYEDYKCFIARFSLHYNKKIKYKNYFGVDSFYQVNIDDGIYHAFLDFDGNIIENKLYKGENLSKIDEIVYLHDRSIYDYEKEREAKVNKAGEMRLNHGINLIKQEGTPYYDLDIIKTLRKKK